MDWVEAIASTLNNMSDTGVCDVCCVVKDSKKILVIPFLVYKDFINSHNYEECPLHICKKCARLKTDRKMRASGERDII